MTSIPSSSAYRVLGPVISVAEFAKTRPGMVIAATPEQIKELKLHDEQVQARTDAINRYSAQQPPDKVFAQVIVNNQMVATVYESGGAYAHSAISGLTEHGSGLDLAKARLADFKRELGGRVIYSDFLPAPAGNGTIPEAVERTFPKVTARSLNGMADSMSWLVARSRMAAENPPAK